MSKLKNEARVLDTTTSKTSTRLDLFDPKSHIQLEKNTKGTGFVFFDKVLGGGYEPKTLIALFGRPKVGKSLVMSNMAARAVDKGLNVCVITLELSARKYIKRIGSNLFSIPYKEYDNFKNEECLGLEKQYQEEYERNNPNYGNLIVKEFSDDVSAIDIEKYCLQLEKKKGIHFDVIFVDYLNILNIDDDFKIKNACKRLRQIAQRNLWCVVTSTHTKKSSFFDDLDLDDIAESYIASIADTVVAVTSPEHSINLKLKCVANRDNGYMGAYSDFEKIFKYYRLDDKCMDRYFISKEETSIKDSTELAAMLAVQKADENKTIDITTPSV